MTKGAIERGLKGVVVYCVEELNGHRTRLIVENNKIVYDDPTFEAIACRLDVIKMDKEFPE